jgi:DNA gyrase subunit B
MRTLLEGLHSRYDHSVVEQAAIAGAFNPERLNDPAESQAMVAEVARRLDMISEESERGWTGVITDNGGFRFERIVRGVKESVDLDSGLVGSQDARMIDQMNAKLREVYTEPPMLRRKEGGTRISGPRELLAGRVCGRPQGPDTAALQGPWRDERGAIVGDDARSACPLAAAGPGQ